jgi:CIC family chloride channel protein
MGAVFAGAARAPITAVIIMFELTGDYAIILPLMAAIVLAAGVSHLLSGDTIYTLKLRRRGIDIDQDPTAFSLANITVGQVMRPGAGAAVPVETALAEAATLLGGTRDGQLPVVDDAGAYHGVITARAVADTLAEPGHENAPVATIVEYPPSVSPDDPLEHALEVLDVADGPVPVLDPDRARLVGWLTHQQVLRALQPRPTPGGHLAPPAPQEPPAPDAPAAPAAPAAGPHA